MYLDGFKIILFFQRLARRNVSLVKADLVLAGVPFITLVGNGAGVTRELTARNAKVFRAYKVAS